LTIFESGYKKIVLSCKVALLSITACGMGITLTEASHVVFAEYYWVPGQLMQAEDRAHRIGQKNAVTVEYMTAEGTVDPYVFRMINRKAKECTAVMDGVGKTLNVDTTADINDTKTYGEAANPNEGDNRSEPSAKRQRTEPPINGDS